MTLKIIVDLYGGQNDSSDASSSGIFIEFASKSVEILNSGVLMTADYKFDIEKYGRGTWGSR